MLGVTSDLVFTILISLISFSLLYIGTNYKDALENKIIAGVLSLAFMASLIIYPCCILDANSIWVYILSFFNIVCCFILTVRFGKPLALKIVSIIISIIISLPLLLFSWFGFIFTLVDFVQVKTTQTILSPSNSYVATVVERDEGALGGSTTVDVFENFKINLLLFEINKKPKRIYTGKWGEADNLVVYFKNDDIVVVNDAEYDIRQ